MAACNELKGGARGKSDANEGPKECSTLTFPARFSAEELLVCPLFLGCWGKTLRCATKPRSKEEAEVSEGRAFP